LKNGHILLGLHSSLGKRNWRGKISRKTGFRLKPHPENPDFLLLMEEELSGERQEVYLGGEGTC